MKFTPSFRFLAALAVLVPGVSFAADPPPPVQSSYFMDIYVRHPLALPIVRHHDYVFTEVRPDGTVNRTELNWGIDAGRYNWFRPFTSFRTPVQGHMSTLADSEANARKTPTITRHHQVQITPEAYASQMGHVQQIQSGGVGYMALPRKPGADNCISSGIPPITGLSRPGFGVFAAPRILRAMDRQGLIVR